MFKSVIEALLTVHGEPIIYKGDGSLSHALSGVFDETFSEIDPDTGRNVTSQTPSILLAVGDLPARPVRDDEFEIRGKIYLVHKFEPDGKGAARIFLSESDEL